MHRLRAGRAARLPRAAKRQDGGPRIEVWVMSEHVGSNELEWLRSRVAALEQLQEVQERPSWSNPNGWSIRSRS